MALIITMLLMAIAYPLLAVMGIYGIIKDSRNIRRYIVMVFIFLVTISYNYVPIGETDLVRYFAQLERYSSIPFSQAFNYQEEGMYVRDILFWIIAQSGCYGLLPAITAGTVYGVGAYITYDSAMTLSQKSAVKYLLLLQFILLPYISIINNIRNVMSFSIVVLAVYRDIFQRKRNILTILMYVLPCFLHLSAFVLLILRVLVIVAKKFQIAAILSVFLVSNLIQVLYRMINKFSGIPQLQRIILTAYAYSSEGKFADSDFAISVANSSWQTVNYYIIMTFAVVVIIYIYFFMCSQKSKNMQDFEIDVRVTELGTFAFLVAIMVVSCSVFTAPHYWRFQVALTMLLGAVLVTLSEKSIIYDTILNKCIWGIALFYFALQVYRNRMYFADTDWIVSSLLHGPLYIAFEVLKGFITAI